MTPTKTPELARDAMASFAAPLGSAARSKMRVNNLFWARHHKEMRGMKHMESSLLTSAFGIMGAR